MCTPESIISDMAGRLTPGQTLISFWGNFIEQGDAISVQNFVDIRRAGSDDDITFDWERERKAYSFSARLPFARAAFAPRTIEASLIDEVAAAYGNLPAARSVATGGGTATRLSSVEIANYSFYVDDAHKLAVSGYKSTFGGSNLTVDLPAEISPTVLSMRDLFPELYLVEGGAWYSFVRYSYKKERHDVGDVAEKADEALARFIRRATIVAGEAAMRLRMACAAYSICCATTKEYHRSPKTIFNGWLDLCRTAQMQ